MPCAKGNAPHLSMVPVWSLITRWFYKLQIVDSLSVAISGDGINGTPIHAVAGAA